MPDSHTPPAPLRRGETRAADATAHPAPGEVLREARGLTRGLDAQNAEDWHRIATELAEAMRTIRDTLQHAPRDISPDALFDTITDLVDDALAKTGLD